MKKTVTTIIATGLVAASALAGVDVTMDFASAYVFRGATFNDGFVVQPGIEASGLGLSEEYGAVAVGAWGNFDVDDYDGALASSEFSEIDWYASYSLPAIVDGLDLFLGYCEYTYPLSGDDTTAPSPADKEINVGAGFEIAGIALGATAYMGVGGAVNGSAYYDISASYAIAVSEELEVSVGALIGYADPDGGESGLNDGVFDVAASYALNEVWSVGASVAYIAQLDDDVLVDVEDGGSYDVDFVGMLSLGASF